MRLEQLVNKYYDSLNDNDLYVISFISQNIELCGDKTVSEIAQYSNVSASTIIRMVKKLGFKGYSEFRYFLKEEIKRIENTKVSSNDYFNTSTVLEDVKATIRLFEQDKSAEKIYELMVRSKRIFAYGTGYGQGLMLSEFSRCLMNSNIHLIIIPSKVELELIAQSITSDDLLFIIGLSGNVDSIETVLKSISLKGTPMVSVTVFSRNPLSYLTDYNLYYQVSNMNKTSNLNNTSFCTLNLVLSLLYEGFINHSKDHPQAFLQEQ